MGHPALSVADSTEYACGVALSPGERRVYGRWMTWPNIAADPETPPCGPPVPGPDGWVVTRHADVLAVLTDPRCVIPAAPEAEYGTLAWLRGTVSRFSPPDRHPARRAISVAALQGLDPEELRVEAARSTAALLDAATLPPSPSGPRTPTSRALGVAGDGASGRRVDVMAVLARRVPVELLAARLGLSDPVAAAVAVAVVATAYHPGASVEALAAADRAVAELLALSPPAPPEIAANRIGLFVQACDATAGLIGSTVRWGLATSPAVRTDDLLAEVLRLDPPVRATRRTTTTAMRLGGRYIDSDAGLLLRFDAANRDADAHAEPHLFRPGRPHRSLTFGAGLRGCPGERHAMALAAGVVDELRRRSDVVEHPVEHEPHPTLRVPARIEVAVR